MGEVVRGLFLSARILAGTLVLIFILTLVLAGIAAGGTMQTAERLVVVALGGAALLSLGSIVLVARWTGAYLSGGAYFGVISAYLVLLFGALVIMVPIIFLAFNR